MILPIPIQKNKCYLAILAILNFSTQLTSTEMEVIATMMQHSIQTLTKETRVILSSLIGKDKFTINNHIKRLKEKNVLLAINKTDLVINPNLGLIVDKCLQDEEIVLELHVS